MKKKRKNTMKAMGFLLLKYQTSFFRKWNERYRERALKAITLSKILNNYVIKMKKIGIAALINLKNDSRFKEIALEREMFLYDVKML